MLVLAVDLLLRTDITASRRGDHTQRGFCDIHLVLRLRVLHLLLTGCGFEMRIEQLHLALKFGLDLGQFDLRLNLDLLMDNVVLDLLLFNLRLVCRRSLISLRPRLQCQ